MSGAIKKTEIVEADLNQLADELKIVGDNIMRIIEISAKVKPIVGLGELSKATKETSENSAELDRIGKKLALSEQRLKDLLDERTKAIIANNKATQEQTSEMKRQSTIANSVEDSYEGINAALNSNIIAYKKLSQAQRENDAVGGQLIKTIQTQDAALKKLDADMGRNQRNVGNYKNGFNGLNFSIMQVGRELPALAYGVNVFAAAISNNIPMVTDEIKRAKLELAALKAEGKVGIPIWKQFANAIFSWQTAMVVGLTLFTMFGKEIVGWIGGLFKTAKALDQTKIAQEQLNEANRKGYENAQSDIIRLKLLYGAINNNTTSLENKKKAIKELQDQYPDYLGKFSEEEILAGKATKAYLQLTNAIISNAKAKAYESVIGENSMKQYELEQKILEDRKKLVEAQAKQSRAESLFVGAAGRDGAEAFAVQALLAKKEVDKLNDSIRQSSVEIAQYEYSSKELAEKINITDLLFGVEDEKVKEKKKKSIKSLRDFKYDMLGDEAKDQRELNAMILKADKDLTKELNDERKQRTLDTISDSVALADEEKLSAQEVAIEKIKSARNSEDEIEKIQHELTMFMIDEDIKAQQRILDTAFLEPNAYEAASKRLRQLRLQRGEEEIRNTEQTEQQKQQLLHSTLQATNELLQSGLSFAQSIYSQQADRAQQAYDTEMQAAGDSLEAQTLAKRKFEAEDKKIKQRQAIASKLQAVLEAGLALALAIATTWKNPLLAALNIGAATIGLGMALATPIPQFAEGGDNTPSTFIAGEEGSELIRTKSGKMILTPNKATLFSDNSLIGSSVTPADETQRMLANMAFNQVREVVDMRETNTHLSGIEKNTRNRESKYVDSKGRTVVKRGTVNSIL